MLPIRQRIILDLEVMDKDEKESIVNILSCSIADGFS